MNPDITSSTVSVDPIAAGQSGYLAFASIAVDLRLRPAGMAHDRIILARSNLTMGSSNLG